MEDKEEREYKAAKAVENSIKKEIKEDLKKFEEEKLKEMEAEKIIKENAENDLKHKKESTDKETNKDANIGFDFSKIFKKKHKESQENTQDSKKESKIEAHEKHRKHEKESTDKETNKDADMSFDAKGFFNKNKNTIKIVALILIPIMLMFFFRLYPTYLPRTGDCDKFNDKIFIGLDPSRDREECWAVRAVYSQVRNSLASQVSSQYPNLPDTQKSAIVKQKFKEILKDDAQRAAIEKQIDETGIYFKQEFQDENGYTYLSDIDSYSWLRQADNIIKNGHIGDRIENGTPINALAQAPFGREETPNLHSYSIVFAYKIGHFFNNKFTTMRASFYVQILFTILGIIAAFFIVRRITDDLGGFIAATVIAIHPFYMSRSFGSDTDVYNVVFPLLITWAFLELLYSNSWKRSAILGAITGLLIGIFAFAWSGWWYVFDFILASCALYLIYLLIVKYTEKKKDDSTNIEIKNIGLGILALIISTGIFVTIVRGFHAFVDSPFSPFRFAKGAASQVFIGDIWPNVYTTVAELNPANFGSIVNNIGGKFYFYMSLVGVIALLVIAIIKTIKHEKKQAKVYMILGILCSLWYGATIYASFSGIRFVLLLVPPFAIALGITYGLISVYGTKWLSESLKLNRKLVTWVVLILLLSTFILPANSFAKDADRTARDEFPIINDAWYNSLTKINKEAANDAIINSWWDFGHHFKYLGNRKVTFDGASQNTPQAHWIGKALITEDEELSIGILRMLDCGANRATIELDKEIKDMPYTIDVMYKIVKMDLKDADKYLEDLGISREKRDVILNYSHCKNQDHVPEDYFITSEDMIGKSGVWGHFGNWDFVRSELWLNSRDWDKEKTINFLISKKLNISRSQAEKLYFELQSVTTSDQANNWIAPWPGYEQRIGRIDCIERNKELLCGKDQQIFIKINLTTMDALMVGEQGFVHPNSFVYVEKDDVQIKKYSDGQGDLGITLVPNDKKLGSYQILISSEAIAGSMFNRLFYLQGHGLKHFKFFTKEQGISGDVIYIWKVDWEGKEKLTYYEEPLKAKIEFG